jgi:hypothetical protein
MKVIETSMWNGSAKCPSIRFQHQFFSLNEVGYKLLDEVKPISYHELSQMTYFKIKTIGSAPSTFSTSLREWILSKKNFQFFLSIFTYQPSINFSLFLLNLNIVLYL